MSEDTKIQLWIPADLLEEFDRRWLAARLDSRSSAIRQLICKYVEACKTEDWKAERYGKEGEA